jgi:DNA mismatch endonuclease (patch repair protein)
MAAIVTKEGRSAVMSAIRSHGNRATELKLVDIFRRSGIHGWRRKQKLFGKPDFVFRRERVAVFIDGCFWHGCPHCYRRPTSNCHYWDGKFLRNKQRDRLVVRALRKLGWKVLRIWQHELERSERVAQRVQRELDSPIPNKVTSVKILHATRSSGKGPARAL